LNEGKTGFERTASLAEKRRKKQFGAIIFSKYSTRRGVWANKKAV